MTKNDAHRKHHRINFRLVFLLTALFAFISAQAYAVTSGTNLWTKVESTVHEDEGHGIAVDSNNNIYVVGQRASDYATIKYDPAGNKKWMKRFSGPSEYAADRATGVAIDKNNNIYVTGTSTAKNEDIVTLKYDRFGNQKWAKRFNSAYNNEDSPVAIAVNAKGYVYVLGMSYASSTKFDMVLIKYDTAGALKWTKRFNGANSLNDWPAGMALDANGNIYVTGSTGTNASADDIVLIKYSPSGSRLWTTKFNGVGNNYDSARAITIDKNNNIYVAGSTDTTTEWNSADAVAIKFNSSGSQVWAQTFNGSGNSFDVAAGIRVDSNGNVYITGQTDSGSNFHDFLTVKYDSAGNRKWVRKFNGSVNEYDYATAIVIDKNNNIYVTGSTFTSAAWNSSNYATIKYDPQGNRKWIKFFNGSGKVADNPNAMAADSANNVVITGSTNAGLGTSKGSDIATLKYAP